MAYTTAEGRRQLLEGLAAAADEFAVAVAALTEVYEQLDERTADRLEEDLFRPVQGAYGRAKRTYTEFAGRYGLDARELTAPAAGAPARGVQGLIERAVERAAAADAEIAELQDSMLPVEVGDTELREALGAVRTMLANVRPAARELIRTFGR
jgi:phage shock protein A